MTARRNDKYRTYRFRLVDKAGASHPTVGRNDGRDAVNDARRLVPLVSAGVERAIFESNEPLQGEWLPLRRPPVHAEAEVRELLTTLARASTIAQRILDHTLDGDGASRVTHRRKVNVAAFLERCAYAVKGGEGRHDVGGRYDVRYRFRDDSELLECGGALDTPEGWAAAA